MAPHDADKDENQDAVFIENNKRYYQAALKRKKPKHKVGDTVLLKTLPGRFARGYHERFGRKEYRIAKVKTNMPIPMYILEDLDPKKKEDRFIMGAAYDEEIQPIRRTADNVFKIQKVLERKKVRGVWMLKVLWENWEKATWIKESEVTEVYNQGPRNI